MANGISNCEEAYQNIRQLRRRASHDDFNTKIHLRAALPSFIDETELLMHGATVKSNIFVKFINHSIKFIMGFESI